jgi:rubrerythrin
MTNKDKTGNERQKRRRQKEKEWLKACGFTSWEQLHTRLVNNEMSIITNTDGRFWTCPKCGMFNYLNWQTCSKCNEPQQKATHEHHNPKP